MTSPVWQKGTGPVLIGLFPVLAAAVGIVILFQTLQFREQTDIAVIRVGVLPDEDKAELNRRYAPLLEHLSQVTGPKFELITPDSYDHLLRIFDNGELDLAYFGGLTFLKAHVNSNALPLVMRDVDTRFTSYFVVGRLGPLRDCNDLTCDELADKVFSFGSKLSTSGHLMPRYYMKTVIGIEPETYFAEVRYSGAHDTTAFRIRDGDVDLGVINSEILKIMLREGRLKQGDLRVLWESPPFPNYVWAIDHKLDEAVRENLLYAFLMLEYGNENHARILSSVGAKSFLPAGTDEFMALQQIAESLGMLSLTE